MHQIPGDRPKPLTARLSPRTAMAPRTLKWTGTACDALYGACGGAFGVTWGTGVVDSAHGVRFTSRVGWQLPAAGFGVFTRRLGASPCEMCDHFEQLWHRTQRATPPKLFSVLQRCPTSFPRLELVLRREPPRQVRRPCPCGSDDQWRCWNRTRSYELMGERRR